MADTCRSCGNPVNKEVRVFCPFCGAVWEKAEPPKDGGRITAIDGGMTTKKSKPKSKKKVAKK